MEECKKIYASPMVQNMQRNSWEKFEPILGKQRKKTYMKSFKKGFLYKCTKNVKALHRLKSRRSKR